MKKILKITALVLGVLLLGLVSFGFYMHEKEPVGVADSATEKMVEVIYSNLQKAAWDSTDWVKWTSPSQNRFIWDKKGGKVRVQFGEIDALIDLETKLGTAKKGGIALDEKAEKEAVKKAFSWFFNDSFWLIAPFKLTDAGTSRSLVTLSDGRKGLKITYGAGGDTPGDRYVWILDEQGVPTVCKMWVSVLPIGGLEATWADWVTLPTGAKVATSHLFVGKMGLKIKDLDGGRGSIEL